MMTDITKVVVIDEQPLFRGGLIGALTSTFKKRTIEQASNGSEGIRLSHQLDPHIVLLGIANQNEAVETIAKISEKCRSTKVIYLSTPGNEVVVQEVLRAGARGCVSKVVSGVEIVRCIQAVLLGESYISPSLAAQLLTRSTQRNRVNWRDDIFATLTTREHKIKRLGIATGGELRAKSFALLQQHFGKSVGWYQAIANGEDDRPVVADGLRKSSGAETTFERDLTEPAEIEAGVQAMADDVWAWCEKVSAFGRTVNAKVKFADFRQITRSRSFAAAVMCGDKGAQSLSELCKLKTARPQLIEERTGKKASSFCSW
jgi:DNA-binding NarL/FixJ family response regulator